MDMKAYSSDLSVSEENLKIAEEKYDEGSNKKSYDASLKSITVSQQIVVDVYRGSIAPLAKELKDRIGIIQDRDNPLKDPKVEKEIDKILAFSEKIEEVSKQIEKLPELLDQEEKFDETEAQITALLDNVQTNFDKVIQYKEIADSTLMTILESDYSFAIGQYRLTQRGIRILEEFCYKIISSIKSDDTKYYTIKAVGYTDTVDFNKNKSLYKDLTKYIQNQLPLEQEERRMFLNQLLSERRAKIIGEAIKQTIERLNMNNKNLKINVIYEGKGETFPSGITPPFPVNDGRRRICKIFVYKTSKSGERS